MLTILKFMKDILYTIAKQNNEIVSINDASKGNSYYCIVCGGGMILKKSEKQLRRPHFSHKSLTVNCTPEGALHLAFKTLLFQEIKDRLQNNQIMQIEWACQFCNRKHSVNLLNKVKNLEIEASLKTCKPDILLFDEDNKPIIAIEIVVTHEPEEESLKCFRDNKIVLVQFNIKNENDLKTVREETIISSLVLCCLNNQRCDHCGDFMYTKERMISNAECWKCGAPMKIADFETNEKGEVNIEEIMFLKKQGIFIEQRQIKDWGKDYVNVCKKCNYFHGPVRVCGYFNNNYKLEKYVVGYECLRCGNKQSLSSNKMFFIE